MARIRCVDCGTVFDSNLQECPSCGCPGNASTIVEEQPEAIHDPNAIFESRPTSDNPHNKSRQSPPPLDEKRKMHPFEITCYVLAVIFALLWLVTQTTSGGIANFDGSISALRKEIAAFGFLIAGRLTALINK